MKRNFFVVANPVSGTKKVETILRELVDYFASKNYPFDVYLTSKSNNGWKIVADNFTEKYTDLVILGGDGTINEAVNGLKYDRPVSILPSGSGNDFCKTLDIGESIEEQIQTLDHGLPVKVDIGECNGRKFVNGVGVGFDGQIVADMQSRKTLLRGAAKYYYFVLRILASYKSRRFSYQIDGKQYEKDLILFCVGNGTTFGGSFKLIPNSSLIDGKLDVCEIGKISALKRFLNIHRLQDGSHGALKAVNFYQAETLRIEANPALFAHIDGEYFGNPPFQFKVLPNALTLRVRTALR